jgi:hypothetical protein
MLICCLFLLKEAFLISALGANFCRCNSKTTARRTENQINKYHSELEILLVAILVLIYYILAINNSNNFKGAKNGE